MSFVILCILRSIGYELEFSSSKALKIDGVGSEENVTNAAAFESFAAQISLPQSCEASRRPIEELPRQQISGSKVPSAERVDITVPHNPNHLNKPHDRF